MINASNEIKQAYDNSTTQVDKIILNGAEYRITNVEYYDDVYNEGNIFGTAIAKGLDFEIENTVNLEGQEIEYLTGIKVDEEIKWISLGNFIVQSVEPNDTTQINKVSAMDYMLKTNIPYETALDYASGAVTLLQVLREVCNTSGLTLATTNFVNSNFIVDSNQFEEGTLNRQVIQAVAQVSGTVAKIKNNQLYLLSPSTTVSKVFTLNNYKEAEIKRTTHPINVVSLGLTDVEGENITLRDEEGISKNGENVLAINDNPFAYTQEKREQLITALFDAVKGFEYKAYTFDCQGLPYLETMDKIQFKDKKGNTYDSYVFRFNYKSPNGLESTIEAPSIISATVNYQNVPSALDVARRTEYRVNKQEGKITQLVSNVEEIEKELLLTAVTEEGKSFHLPDSADNYCKSVEIFGESTQDGESTSVSGKNYLNIESEASFTIQTLPIQLPAGTYYLTCENVVKGGSNDPQIIINGSSKSLESGKKEQFTTENDISEVTLYSNGLSWGESANVTSTVTKLMISKKGDFYVPYNHIGFKSTGKNLFNKDNVITGKYINANGVINDYYAYSLSDYMAVEPNTNYSYQGISEYSEHGAFYDEKKELISVFAEAVLSEYQKITIPENARYVRFTVINTNNDIDNFQLEQGEATPYDAYKESITTIPLLHDMRSLPNGIRDRIHRDDGTNKWYDEQNIGYTESDGLYELAESIVTEITDEAIIAALESIRTYKGITNIETDAPSILTYYRDVPIVEEYETKQNANKTYKAIKSQFADLTIEQDNIKATVSETITKVDEQGNKIGEVETSLNQVTQTAEETKSEVSKKVGEDEIISKINQSAEQVQIDAGKVSLKRKNNRLNC